MTTHIPSILCHSSHQSPLSTPTSISSQNEVIKTKEEKQGDIQTLLNTKYNNVFANLHQRSIQTDNPNSTANLSESANEFISKPILMTNCTTLPSSIFSTIPINGLNPIKQATVHVVYSSKPISALKSNDPSIATTPTNTTPKQKQSPHNFINEVKNKLDENNKIKSVIMNSSVASLNIPSSVQSHQSSSSSPFINNTPTSLESTSKTESEFTSPVLTPVDQTNKLIKRKRSSDSVYIQLYIYCI